MSMRCLRVQPKDKTLLWRDVRKPSISNAAGASGLVHRHHSSQNQFLLSHVTRILTPHSYNTPCLTKILPRLRRILPPLRELQAEQRALGLALWSTANARASRETSPSLVQLRTAAMRTATILKGVGGPGAGRPLIEEVRFWRIYEF